MNKWIGFVAGGLFALGWLLTCGGGNRGTGPATAAGSAVWEYALVYTYDATVSMPSGVGSPAGFSSCTAMSGTSRHACQLNALGAAGWEMVGAYSSDGDYVAFKRQK